MLLPTRSMLLVIAIFLILGLILVNLRETSWQSWASPRKAWEDLVISKQASASDIVAAAPVPDLENQNWPQADAPHYDADDPFAPAKEEADIAEDSSSGPAPGVDFEIEEGFDAPVDAPISEHFDDPLADLEDAAYSRLNDHEGASGNPTTGHYGSMKPEYGVEDVDTRPATSHDVSAATVDENSKSDEANDLSNATTPGLFDEEAVADDAVDTTPPLEEVEVGGTGHLTTSLEETDRVPMTGDANDITPSSSNDGEVLDDGISGNFTSSSTEGGQVLEDSIFGNLTSLPSDKDELVDDDTLGNSMSLPTEGLETSVAIDTVKSTIDEQSDTFSALPTETSNGLDVLQADDDFTAASKEWDDAAPASLADELMNEDEAETSGLPTDMSDELENIDAGSVQIDAEDDEPDNRFIRRRRALVR